ncbi:MAG: fimbria/pilus outer membrane usher protein [Elusimicrobia bacterium]|nr:fimbria/pilus outer membrane usher protein [Elusimicrobiota bacterium]
MFLDGRQIDEVPAFFGKKDALTAVDGQRFAQALRPYLLPERFTELFGRIDAAGKLAPDAIRACGIGFSFDSALLEVRVSLPAVQRPVMPLDLAHLREEVAVKAVPPAAFSGYLNLLAGGEYDQGTLSGAGSGWQRPVFDFAGAVRASSTVLEGVVTHRGQTGVPWQRQDFRLVYDRPKERVRTSLGDVTYDIRGFQSFQRMGGVAAARNLNLQRSRSSAPSASTTLVLERNSRVDVWINGQRSQTLQLAPGRYDVRNFPLALGTNDVQLRVTDEVGRVEIVRFPFVFDSALLDRGEEDFSCAAGLLSKVTPQGRSYDADRPALSAYHAVGLTKQFTAGVNAQGSPRQRVLGAEGLWATGFGTILADLAASRADFAGGGGAVRLQYRYSDWAARGDNQSWTAAATYRSRSFTALGDTVASDPYALELGLVYTRRLLWGVLGSLGLGRQIGQAGQPDGTTEDLNLSRAFGRGLRATLELSRRSPVVNQGENRLLLSLVWMFGGVNSVTASHDSATGASRLQWDHSAPQRVRSADSDVFLTRDRSSETGQGTVQYRDYRFSADAAGSSERDRTPGSKARGRMSFDLGTALAFADGHAALSRPITASFVIVSPHPSLAGQAINVNVGNGIPEAKTGPLGPAVLPELTSYENHRVELSAPELPPWIDLGPQPRSVYPAYRSGTYLVAGTAASVIVEGLLVDGAGRPLPLEPGDIESLDDPGTPPHAFFTATTGRFAVEGLKPGRLRVILRNYPDRPILLTVPPGSAGMVDVGSLSLSPLK